MVMPGDAEPHPRFHVPLRVPAAAADRRQDVVIGPLVAPDIFLDRGEDRRRDPLAGQDRGLHAARRPPVAVAERVQQSEVQMHHRGLHDHRLAALAVGVVEHFADQRLQRVAVHAFMDEDPRPRVPDTHPAGAVLAGAGVEIVPANHEMDREQHVLAEREGRALPALEDEIHRLAVADHRLPGVPVGVGRVFAVDRGDRVLVRDVYPFDAVGRPQGAGARHAREQPGPAARFRYDMMTQPGPHLSRRLQDPHLRGVQRLTAVQHARYASPT